LNIITQNFIKKITTNLKDKIENINDKLDEIFDDKSNDSSLNLEKDLKKEFKYLKKNINKFYKDNKTYIHMGLIGIGTAIAIKWILQPNVVIINK